MKDITFSIDGKECKASRNQTIAEAAEENGVYIPVLCNFKGMKPAGTCRICTIKAGGRYMAACTTPVGQGMVVENMTSEIEDMRKQIIEMMFVEGNHMCPTCEKSGNCELQALAYRYQMMVPRFPYLWPRRAIMAETPFIYLDRNRCVQCLRCVRDIKSPDGKNVFAVTERGEKTQITMDRELASGLSENEASKAMYQCPVGCIIKKGIGFKTPIGQRKFDSHPIGSEFKG